MRASHTATTPRRLVTLTLLTAAALLTAGCVTNPLTGSSAEDPVPTVPDATWALDALAHGEGHDHTNPDHHRGLTTPNFQVVGHDPLISEDYGTTAPGNLCGDAKTVEDGRRLAVVESRGDIAFSVTDVTDAANPQWLGELVMRTTYVYDLAAAPDGKHVVLATADPKAPHNGPALARSADGAPVLEGVAWRTPCAPGEEVPLRWAVGDDVVPRPASLLLVSIEDPAEPTIIDQRPLPGLGHSIYSTRADGRTWVVASTWAATSATSTFEFYELVDTPLGKRLGHLTTYSVAMHEDDPDALQRYMGHNEAEIHVHPVTGQTLAWLALWDHGILILDVSTPQMPELVGRWDDYDPANPGEESGNAHSVRPLADTWDGRHYTLVGPEHAAMPKDGPTGVVYVLDTTDPANPQAVAGWTLPHEVEWSGRLMWSNHYLTAYGKTAFVSMYHGGVWALDLSAIQPGNWTDLPSVGAFLPVQESPKPPADPFRWTPTLEEVHAFEDGTLVTFDSNSGLYTFRYDASNPQPAPAPWPVPNPHGG